MTLTLPRRLSELVSEDARRAQAEPASISLRGATWTEVAGQIEDRFPHLARLVFCQSGKLAPGFALVVNDELMPHGEHASLALGPGDELCIIEVFAGG